MTLVEVNTGAARGIDEEKPEELEEVEGRRHLFVPLESTIADFVKVIAL